jgi:hypothetical protein
MMLRKAWFVAVSAWLIIAGDSQDSAAQFKAHWDRVRLVVGDQSLAPVGRRAAVADEFTSVALKNDEATFRRFGIDQGRIFEIDPSTGKPLWSVATPDAALLRHVATSGDILLFAAGVPPDAEKTWTRAAEVRRFDSAKKSWLSALKFPPAGDDVSRSAHSLQVAAVDATQSGVAVLSIVMGKPDGGFAGPPAHGYRVDYYAAGADSPAWTKTFKLRGQWNAGILLGEPHPLDSLQSLRRLTLIQDSDGILVIACAGTQEDLVCLTNDGREYWKLERIWEFERSFIGPSVWEHHTTRFGVDPLDEDFAESTPDTPEAKKYRDECRDRIREAKDRFDKDMVGKIVAGPVRFERSLFVAVNRGRKNDYADNITDLVAVGYLYEIELDSGHIRGLVAMPRAIVRWTSVSREEGLLWNCENGTLAMAGTVSPDTRRGFRLADDMLVPIRWYREYYESQRERWFAAPGDQNVSTGAGDLLIRTAGTYTRDADDKTLKLELGVVNLATGMPEPEWVLEIPFEGTIPYPAGVGVSGSPNDVVYAHAPWPLPPSDLRWEGNRLRIILQRKTDRQELTFDVSKIDVRRSANR